ncbi:MAG: DUF2339 domain-containing protein [Verrucomicrobia bacterium]|nr:DUF2339 domain-containing protein [Verrucomicrobiota bacterium]MBI3869916.1 DUF2339 domain-containing protein [Verrucomicrobiota bacterium]
MEIIGIIFLLGAALVLVVLPIVNAIHMSEGRRTTKSLVDRVELLAAEVQSLRKRLDAAAPGLPSSAEPGPKPRAETEEPGATRREKPPQPQDFPQDATTPPQPADEVTTPSTPSIPEEELISGMIAKAPAALEEKPQGPPPIPPSIPPIPPRTTQPPGPRKPAIQWETFVGAKLIMWLGGLLLFLTAAYFVKYSIEKDMIPPEVRVTLGFLLGIGLVVGGFALKRKAYEAASQTFCATGIVILYAVTFACRSAYHFAAFTPGMTFALMALITTSAFLLAVRMNALVVAVLGMVGGFLTPVLLSTGVDNPLGLFGYVALLNVGLIAVALARPWGFLVALAAAGTGLMELGWAERYLNVEKLSVALWTHIGFNALFFFAAEAARRRGRSSHWWIGASAGLALLAQTTALALGVDRAMGSHIGLLGSIAIAGDLCLLGLTLRFRGVWWGQPAGGLLIHLFFATWMSRHLTEPLLYWALGGVLLVALIHGSFPLLMLRVQPESRVPNWAHAFPPAALLLLLLPIFKLPTAPILVWPVIFAIDLIAVGFTILTRSLLSLLSVLLITGVVAISWIFSVPAQAGETSVLLLIIGAIAVVFVFAGMFALRKLASASGSATGSSPGNALGGQLSDEELRAQLPALTALMPFVLLILVVSRMPLPNPSPVFALAMALIVLLLSVARAFAQNALPLIALGCVVALQMVWHQKWFHADISPLISLGWLLAFSGLILAYPFASRAQCMNTSKPWAAAALALPAHFYLIYRSIDVAWPNSMMGLVPAVLSLPMLVSALQAARWFASANPRRNAVLAWLGGSALFFITLIFPIQFERQWITVSWALEGAALCWMFRRLPHPGVRWTGLGLLAVTMVRLTINPAVLEYHPRSGTAIFNWYLYTYGCAIASFFLAAHWLAPPRDRVGGRSCLPLLRGAGGLLLFLLVNIEIADYFSAVGERSLTFQFGGNFARDMSYTIAWGVFALGLVSVGIAWKTKGARYSGLTLLGITLLKLFLHDLGQLPQLYRIGALAGVAVAAILASILYQKFVASEESSDKASPPSAP